MRCGASTRVPGVTAKVQAYVREERRKEIKKQKQNGRHRERRRKRAPLVCTPRGKNEPTPGALYLTMHDAPDYRTPPISPFIIIPDALSARPLAAAREEAPTAASLPSGILSRFPSSFHPRNVAPRLYSFRHRGRRSRRNCLGTLEPMTLDDRFSKKYFIGNSACGFFILFFHFLVIMIEFSSFGNLF